jgi:hypothetical protein
MCGRPFLLHTHFHFPLDMDDIALIWASMGIIWMLNGIICVRERIIWMAECSHLA